MSSPSVPLPFTIYLSASVTKVWFKKDTSIFFFIIEAEFQALQCTHFFHMVSVYQVSGNMNEKSKKWKSILSGKSICVHFNFRVNPVVMILRPAGSPLLMAEC